MKTVWTKGYKDKEKKDVMKNEFKKAKLLRERLTLILQEKISTEHKATRSKDAYSDANWAYRQADSQGYLRALHEIISIISE
jgi:hypothetical protein